MGNVWESSIGLVYLFFYFSGIKFKSLFSQSTIYYLIIWFLEYAHLDLFMYVIPDIHKILNKLFQSYSGNLLRDNY
jgi:hypothetical protein